MPPRWTRIQAFVQGESRWMVGALRRNDGMPQAISYTMLSLPEMDAIGNEGVQNLIDRHIEMLS